MMESEAFALHCKWGQLHLCAGLFGSLQQQRHQHSCAIPLVVGSPIGLHAMVPFNDGHAPLHTPSSFGQLPDVLRRRLGLGVLRRRGSLRRGDGAGDGRGDGRGLGELLRLDRRVHSPSKVALSQTCSFRLSESLLTQSTHSFAVLALHLPGQPASFASLSITQEACTSIEPQPLPVS